MCLAIPARLVSVEGEVGKIDLSGSMKTVVLTLLEEPPEPGQFVLVHAGFAIEVIDAERAAELEYYHRAFYG